MGSERKFFVLGEDGFPSAEVKEYNGDTSSDGKRKHIFSVIKEDYDVVAAPCGLTFFGIPGTVILMSTRNQKSDEFMDSVFRDIMAVPPILGCMVVCKEINGELSWFTKEEAEMVASIMRSPEPDVFKLGSRSPRRREALSKGVPFPVTNKDLGAVMEKICDCDADFWWNSMRLHSSDGGVYVAPEDFLTVAECAADCFSRGGFIRFHEKFTPDQVDEVDLIRSRLVLSIQEYLKDASHADIESWSVSEADKVVQMAVYGKIVWEDGAVSRSERINDFLKTVVPTTPQSLRVISGRNSSISPFGRNTTK